MQTNTSKEYYEKCTLEELEQNIITFNGINEKQEMEMNKIQNSSKNR